MSQENVEAFRPLKAPTSRGRRCRPVTSANPARQRRRVSSLAHRIIAKALSYAEYTAVPRRLVARRA
jgi:hypothetical protein